MPAAARATSLLFHWLNSLELGRSSPIRLSGLEVDDYSKGRKASTACEDVSDHDKGSTPIIALDHEIEDEQGDRHGQHHLHKPIVGVLN